MAAGNEIENVEGTKKEPIVQMCIVFHAFKHICTWGGGTGAFQATNSDIHVNIHPSFTTAMSRNNMIPSYLDLGRYQVN